MSDTPRTHFLKCWPEYFAALVDGTKTFEVRYNDRDFKLGDELVIQEWSHKSAYSGRQEKRTVSYVLAGLQDFGISTEYVVLGFAQPELSRLKAENERICKAHRGLMEELEARLAECEKDARLFIGLASQAQTLMLLHLGGQWKTGSYSSLDKPMQEVCDAIDQAMKESK